MGTRHPTAIISPTAQIAESAVIGPFCVIEDDVVIGERTIVKAYSHIAGPTRIGDDNRIFGFTSIGMAAQHKDEDDNGGGLVIGNNNVIREHCTLHRGLHKDDDGTVIGDDNMFLVGVHIAHNCKIGNHTVFINNSTIAGHVEVEDYAVLGGVTYVHQYCRIGCHAFTGRITVLTRDLTPYTMAVGCPSETKGLNLEGLRRRGFGKDVIHALNTAYKFRIRKHRHISKETVDQLAEQHAEVNTFLKFIDSSTRGITA